MSAVAIKLKKFLRMVTYPGSVITKDVYSRNLIFREVNYNNDIKRENKFDPAL
jgi:hypothetical protein